MEITEAMVKRWQQNQAVISVFYVGDHRMVEEARGTVQNYTDDFVIIKTETGDSFITWEAMVNIED